MKMRSAIVFVLLLGIWACNSEEGGPVASVTDPVEMALESLLATTSADVDSNLLAATVASLTATEAFASVGLGMDANTIEIVSRDGRRLYIDTFWPEEVELPAASAAKTAVSALRPVGIETGATGTC